MVRMGIHAGEAVLGGRDYTGIDVHRTARLSAAGHGGQILVSEAAWALAPDNPVAGVSYRDLGIHQLRDLPGPERIRQLIGPDLASDFQPLRHVVAEHPDESARADDPVRRPEARAWRGFRAPPNRATCHPHWSRRHGQDASRDRDCAMAPPELRRRRLVRGARYRPRARASAAHDRRNTFYTRAAGPIDRRCPDRAPCRETISSVLDNFEQVTEAAPRSGGCSPRRESCESSFRAGNPWPSRARPSTWSLRSRFPPSQASRLRRSSRAWKRSICSSIERGRCGRTSPHGCECVCGRGHLPPARRTAPRHRARGCPRRASSPRTRSSPRLDHRLTLLASSHRDLPERQRTLRGAIDWSHELLSPPERAVFRRFSVFSGGAAFDALARSSIPAKSWASTSWIWPRRWSIRASCNRSRWATRTDS